MSEQLIIPVRFEYGKAAADLKNVAAAGKKAGDATAQGFRQATNAAHGAGQAVQGVNDQLVGLIKTQMGLSAIKGLAGAIGQEFKRAADYTRDVAMRFAEIRQALQQLAALRGEPNTNRFALEHVRSAAAAGMLPAEFQKAQEAFLNPAAAQLEGPNPKMTPQQALEFQTRVAKAAKAHGMDVAAAMGTAGNILQQSEGPISVPEAMERFNKGFGVLEKGPIEVGRAVQMVPAIMSHGLSTEEAATLLNVVQPAGPGEEETSANAALRALEEMRVSGKGEEFGVNDDMKKMEALKAFGKNLAARDQALQAQGMSKEKAEIEIARQLEEAGIAKDSRERRGLVRGLARNGIQKGELARYEAIGANIAPDADIDFVRDYERTDAGRANQRAANKELEKARIGAAYQPVQEQLELAEEEAIREGRMNRPQAENLVRGAIGTVFMTGQDTDEQVKREIALGNLRRKAVGLGITRDVYSELPRDQTMVSAKDVMFRTAQSVDEEIADLLRQILAEQKKRNGPGAPEPIPPGYMPRPRDRQ